MGRELGRISGPLLADNLLRNGIDIAFETSLLYLNVNGDYIGVNTDAPSRALTVNGLTHTTDLIVDNLATFANLEFSSNQIQNPLSSITIAPSGSNPVVTVPTLATNNLTFASNTILNGLADSNIEFSATGIANIRNNTVVKGSLHSTGDITFDGGIQFGNASTDTIDFVAEIDSNIFPNITNTYDLGSPTLAWNSAFVKNLHNNSVSFNTTGLLSATMGNIVFVDNTISNVNNDTTLVSSSGILNLNTDTGNTIKITGNQIINETNSALTIASTAYGYTKLDGKGVVIPSGTTAERGTAVERGLMRWNTQTQSQEIYNGTAWQPVIGTTGLATLEQVNDIMDIWSLILG